MPTIFSFSTFFFMTSRYEADCTVPRGVCQKNSSTEIFFGENGRGIVVTRPSYLATYGPKSTPPIVAALSV